MGCLPNRPPWVGTYRDVIILCKNALGGDLRVLVNSRIFTEDGPESLRPSGFSGRHLQFNPSAKLRPSQNCLRGHRSSYGFKA